NLDQPDWVIQEFEDTIFGQDQVVVESQRPEQVPFDLAAELHLKFDAVAVAYRKAMRALGLASSAPAGTVGAPWAYGRAVASSIVSSAAGSASKRSSGIGRPLRTERP